jgi:ribosomal protein S18 acetylase RimI-like enzyme
MTIRKLSPNDPPAIRQMLEVDTFNAGEVDVALELIEDALADPQSGYRVLVAADERDTAVGYVCFGETPMTQGTFDLYWLCTHPSMRGRGIAGRLVEEMERTMREGGGRVIRVETSQQEAYGAARSFYDRHGYREAGRIPGFYKPGDDLVILWKPLAER